MQSVSATEAKQNFAAILDKVQRGPVLIRRHDREVAVLVSPEDYERIRQSHVAELNRLADEVSREAKENGLTEEVLRQILAER
jgi:prevent-host-death family protein